MKRKIVCDYFQRGIATRISLEQKTIINETIKTHFAEVNVQPY